MLLLDTTRLPPARRAAALEEALAGAALPCRAEPLTGELAARVHRWRFGWADLVLLDSTPVRLRRPPSAGPRDAGPAAALAVRFGARCRVRQFDRDRVAGPGDLVVDDLSAPSELACPHGGAAWALRVPRERLGLLARQVRAAAPRPAGSPLHDLVLTHLTQLAEHAPELSADPGGPAVGAATGELVRALVTSAGAGGHGDPPEPAGSLVADVKRYVGLHLHEPGLTPAHLAHTHHVSVRQLYKTCAAAGLSLEQWIIGQRLELARTELASPMGARRSIAATARASGFRDPSHFARRFRDAFGMTPRDWQQHVARRTG